MKFQTLAVLLIFSALSGCSQQSNQMNQSSNASTPIVSLGSLMKCKQYSGLPNKWLEHKTAGMSFIQGGEFAIGNNNTYPEEKSLIKQQRHIDDFYIDATETTNAQFASFVQATGYVTEAEQQGEAAVFVKPTEPVKELNWWKLEDGISWRFPWGRDSLRKILPNEPVRLVTLKDAIAYADWLGRTLPTEEQWEYAAKAFSREADVIAEHQGNHTNANVWQGNFPYENRTEDGFEDVAPVGCFAPNPLGLYDMLGNVWEYTRSPFSGHDDDHLGNHQQLKQHTVNVANRYTIKGGSYLCADNYCARYRATSRQPQEADLAISHVGFRTVKRK